MVKFFLATLAGSAIFLLTICAVLAAWPGRPAAAQASVQMSKVGQAFEIPYRLTETNHFLVRVRINGKGPFNFLLDSGAPATYIATETATKAGLKPTKGQFWTPIHRLDLEGGAVLRDIKARVEDPFQLVGMNALGLPGATIEGILGFTVLARFRLEIDPTRDYMTWMLLDHVPPDPPIPRPGNAERYQAQPELQALSALGPLAKGLAFLIGKQPEEQRLLRGFLGLQWCQVRGPATLAKVQIQEVLKGSPADRAGLHAGDYLDRICSHPIDSTKSARSVLAKVQAGDPVELSIQRPTKDGKELQNLTITVTAEEGF
jgi:hypothetical protein